MLHIFYFPSFENHERVFVSLPSRDPLPLKTALSSKVLSSPIGDSAFQEEVLFANDDNVHHTDML